MVLGLHTGLHRVVAAAVFCAALPKSCESGYVGRRNGQAAGGENTVVQMAFNLRDSDDGMPACCVVVVLNEALSPPYLAPLLEHASHTTTQLAILLPARIILRLPGVRT